MVEGEGELTQLKNNNSRKKKTMEYDLAKIGGNRNASDKAILDCLLPFFLSAVKRSYPCLYTNQSYCEKRSFML